MYIYMLWIYIIYNIIYIRIHHICYRYGALIFHSWIFDDFGAYFSKRKHTEDIKWTAEPLTPSTLDLPGGPGYIRYFSLVGNYHQLSPIKPQSPMIIILASRSQRNPKYHQLSFAEMSNHRMGKSTAFFVIRTGCLRQ